MKIDNNMQISIAIYLIIAGFFGTSIALAIGTWDFKHEFDVSMDNNTLEAFNSINYSALNQKQEPEVIIKWCNVTRTYVKEENKMYLSEKSSNCVEGLK